MNKRSLFGAATAGFCAGIVNGIFGGAGGMVLIPMLGCLTSLDPAALFPMSLTVMAPVCALSLWLSRGPLPWPDALPYLIGGAVGGAAAGLWGKRIPTRWLHGIFGALLLWGGVRYLW